MNTKHLTEEEVQTYAIEEAACDVDVRDHVQGCQHCRARVETYRMLITVIKEQPEPAFDFDLSELVLSRLPQTPAKTNKEKLPLKRCQTLLGGLATKIRIAIDR